MRLERIAVHLTMRRPLACLIAVFAISAFAGTRAVLAPEAMATAAYVQSASGSNSGTSLGVSYSSNVAAGNLLVGQFRANGTTTVSDSVNGSWTKAVSTTSEGVTHSIWYRQNTAAGKPTVTVSGATSGSLRAVLGEYSGVAASGALDQTACNQGTTTSVTTGATASVVAGDLLYAGVGAFEHPLTITAGTSNGLSATLRTQFSGTFGTSGEEDVTSTAAGAQNASFTLSEATPSGWAACAAAFHKLIAPENTALPVLSGTAEQGKTLTTTNGSWANGPTSFAYAWKRCAGAECTTISGATSSSYTLQAADVGDTIRSVVTASNGAGEASATSEPSATVKATEGEAAGPTCNKYANTGASGTENGEKTHPYKTLKKLFEHTAAGEVGCLEEGQTFNEGKPIAYTQSGSAGSPLTISSTNVNNPATITNAMYIKGNYVTLTHVKLKWVQPKPWGCWDSSGNVVAGKIIKFKEGKPNHPCEAGTEAEHAEVLDIYGEHVSVTYDDISSENTDICVSPQWISGSTEAKATETLIEHNRIHECGNPYYESSVTGNTSINEERGWHMHGVYDQAVATTVKNNYIYDNARNGILNHASAAAGCSALCKGTYSHNVIARNGTDVTLSEGTEGNKVLFNVITDAMSPSNAFRWGLSDEPTGSQKNTAENNIFYNNPEAEIRETKAGALILSGNKTATNPEYACGTCEAALANFEIKGSYAAEGYGPESPPTKY